MLLGAKALLLPEELEVVFKIEAVLNWALLDE